MFSTSSVGSTTSECSLSDQVKKYKPRNILHEETKNREEEKSSTSRKSSNSKNMKKIIDPLSALCIKVISEHFSEKPKLKGLPQRFLPEITLRLPLDLDIKVAVPHVMDEGYWKRRCINKEQWKNLQIQNHGLTWKQLYLEKNLQDLLESYDPAYMGLDDLLELVKTCQDNIFSLEILQLLSHLDIDQITSLLPNLTCLSLTYGVKQIGMKYERMLFGMKISDATSLSRCLKYTTTLTTIILPENLIDDDLLRMLMSGLMNNSTITYLDLSHNRITNHGARLISKLLDPTSVLTTLDLCDNQIHAEGGRYLGRGLHNNSSLTSLNMRLNRLTDDGGRLLLDGVSGNVFLKTLNLSSNSLSQQTAQELSQLLLNGSSCALHEIDLTGNELNEEDARVLLKGIASNNHILGMDLRGNEIPKDSDTLVEIARILRKNEIESRIHE